MKTTLSTTKAIVAFSVIIFISPLFFSLKAQPNKTAKRIFLEIDGEIYDKETPLDEAVVKLMYDNKTVDFMSLHKESTFTFDLKKGKYYSIEISREGYNTMLIGVSTVFPEGAFSRDAYTHELHVEMVKKPKPKKGQKEEVIDSDALDFPVAILEFNAKTQAFDFNKKYTSQIKKEIKEAKAK